MTLSRTAKHALRTEHRTRRRYLTRNVPMTSGESRHANCIMTSTHAPMDKKPQVVAPQLIQVLLERIRAFGGGTPKQLGNCVSRWSAEHSGQQTPSERSQDAAIRQSKEFHQRSAPRRNSRQPTSKSRKHTSKMRTIAKPSSK